MDESGKFRQMVDRSVVQYDRNGKMKVLNAQEVAQLRNQTAFVNGMNASQSNALGYLPIVQSSGDLDNLFLVLNATEGPSADTARVQYGQLNPMLSHAEDDRIEAATDVLRDMILNGNINRIISYSQGTVITGNAIMQAYRMDPKSTADLSWGSMGGGHSVGNIPESSMIGSASFYRRQNDTISANAPVLSGSRLDERTMREELNGHRTRTLPPVEQCGFGPLNRCAHGLSNYSDSMREFLNE